MTGRSIYGRAVGIGAIVLMLLVSSTPARANIIANGGFETGQFDDWLPIPPPVEAMFFVSGHPHTGHYAAWFGAIGIVDETLSQQIPTVAGDRYVVDFWLAHGMSNHSNDFSVWWNGVQLMSIVNANSFAYTAYSFSVVAEGASSTLMFAGREVANFFTLDDVRVVPAEAQTAAQVVPEPLTLLLVGAGVSGLMRSRRRRLQSGADKV
jgi:hypothetical protein